MSGGAGLGPSQRASRLLRRCGGRAVVNEGVVVIFGLVLVASHWYIVEGGRGSPVAAVRWATHCPLVELLLVLLLLRNAGIVSWGACDAVHVLASALLLRRGGQSREVATETPTPTGLKAVEL